MAGSCGETTKPSHHPAEEGQCHGKAGGYIEHQVHTGIPIDWLVMQLHTSSCQVHLQDLYLRYTHQYYSGPWMYQRHDPGRGVQGHAPVWGGMPPQKILF